MPGESAALGGLLSPKALDPSLRELQRIDLRSRENLKALLPAQSAAEPSPAPAEASLFARLTETFEILLRDFSQRQREWLKLNRARREQIESRIQTLGKLEQVVPLPELLQLPDDSPAGRGRQLFLREAASFQLQQALLLRRWVDQGHLALKDFSNEQLTANWQITHCLRRLQPSRLLDRSHCCFLRQNMYSWFHPAKESWAALVQTLRPLTLADTGAAVLLLAADMAENNPDAHRRSRREGDLSSRLGWQLLHSARLREGTEGNEIALAGSWCGQALLSLPETPANPLMHLQSADEWERYTLEMLALWIDFPQACRLRVTPSQGTAEPADSIFQAGDVRRGSPALAAVFLSESHSLDAALSLLEQLREGGLLVLSSADFWMHEEKHSAQQLREALLKKACLLAAVDLRGAIVGDGSRLPRQVLIAKKTSSREIRDSHRPQILRLRGTFARAEDLLKAWQRLCAQGFEPVEPGVVRQEQAEHARLEYMAAAAPQHCLRSAPWTNLADPAFYEVASALRRYPTKAFSLGNIIRLKHTEELPPFQLERAIFFHETAGKHLEAAVDPRKDCQYLFVLDRLVQEQPAFLAAMACSAPSQFWYRLEWEHDGQQRTGKGQNRQAEQLLKLLPLPRLFENGSLIPAAPALSQATSHELAAAASSLSLRMPALSLSERAELQEIVIQADKRLRHHLSTLQALSHTLYPESRFLRCLLPESLPMISPTHALRALSHLEQVPLAQHPAFQIIPLRTMSDFKISETKLTQGTGPYSELVVFAGADAVLRIHGPTLFLRAAQEEIDRRFGKPWMETKNRLAFPLDAALVVSQVAEMTKALAAELYSARGYAEIIDDVAASLFGVPATADETPAGLVRGYLFPQSAPMVALHPAPVVAVKQSRDSARSKGLLQ